MTLSSGPDADQLLVARVLLDDDRHAFTELVRRHQSTIRLVLRRLNGNDAALADDLAQETFLQVYKKLRQYRGEAQFSTWIYRIAHNVFLSHMRSREQHEALTGDVSAEQADAGHAAAPLAYSSALKLDLISAMTTLSEAERAAIIHCYYQDLSHEEAAYALACPLGTVKTNVLRAKHKLGQFLSAWRPSSGQPVAVPAANTAAEKIEESR